MIRSTGYRQLEGVSYSDSEWILLPLVGVRKTCYCPETVYRYLRGRAGQTMEVKQIAKNFWMRAKLALDMLRQFTLMERFATRESIEYIRPRLANIISSVYRGCIFGHNGLTVNLDLARFDADLKDTDPILYEKVSSEPYCRRIPYQYIRDWRTRSWGRHLWLMLCKAYSWVTVHWR